MAKTMTPPKSIISIIGFWSIPRILNESMGTRYTCCNRGGREIWGRTIGDAGFRGVPIAYGRTSNADSRTSIRSCPNC
jgi:hypothetical protein